MPVMNCRVHRLSSRLGRRLALCVGAVMVLSAGPAFAQFAQQGPKLVGSGAVGSGFQGQSVSLSADGNTAIVGGPGDSGGLGAAWIWTRSGGIWTQGPKLVGSGAAGGVARQGDSVSMSADGNTAIVGGDYDSGQVGAVWVWAQIGGVWTQQGPKLVGSGAVGFVQQGQAVALSADGNTAIVAAFRDNNLAGAVWIWTRSGGVWSQQGAKLVGAGSIGNGYQGFSVSLSADGNTAAVGGMGDNGFAGAVWVWVRSEGVWTQQGAKLVGLGAVGTAQQGFAVSLAADGNTLVVGGQGDNSLAGAMWVWTRSAGVWSQQGAKLVGSGAVGAAHQGGAISLSADGDTAVVGGKFDNDFAGASWVWTRSAGAWSQQGSKLFGTGALGPLGFQGASVAVAADASTAIVGGTNDNGGAGAMWVFVATSAVPGAFGKISPANGAVGQSSGPTLSWGPSTSAERYEYCYDLTNDNACSEWISTGTNTSVALSVAGNTTHNWQVRAVNGGLTTYADGSAGAFWEFTTQAVQGGAGTLIGPSNGATGQPTKKRPPQMYSYADSRGDAFLDDSATGHLSRQVPDWALYSGDFNGDGLGDLLLYRSDAGDYYVALNNGAGYHYTAGHGWAAGWTPYIGDFDGDGSDDLFLYNATAGVWVQMMSDGVGGFSVGGHQTWTTGWQLYLTIVTRALIR